MLDLFGDEVDFEAKTSPEAEEFVDCVLPDLYDWLRAIKDTKIDLRVAYTTGTRGTGKNKKTVNIKPDPTMSSFSTFSILMGLDQSDAARPYAHMMNERPHLSKEHVYLFLMQAVPAHNSFDKWTRNKNDKRLKILCELFECSLEKAKEYFTIYSSPEIDSIIKQFEGDASCPKKKTRK